MLLDQFEEIERMGALGGLIGWHNCKTNFSVTNCYAAINMELTGTNRQPGGFIGYKEADATGVLKEQCFIQYRKCRI